MNKSISIFIISILVFSIAFYAEINYADEARVITISEGIQMVLKDSRVIKAAVFSEDMAFEDSLLSRSALLPNLSANASKSYYQFQPDVKLGDLRAFTANKNPYSYGFDVYQTLFDFGKTVSNYKASKDFLQAAKANTESVKKLAVLEFIVAYFDLLETEKMIAVAQKETETLNSYLSDVQHLYEQGVVVKNDLLPAQVRLADAKQKLISVQNAGDIAAARLNNILTLPIREKIEPRDIQMDLPQFPDIEEAFKTAQTQRPEIAFLESQIKASGSIEKAKGLGNFPVIFADAGYEFTKNNYIVHQGSGYLTLGAKADLYDGGLSQAGKLKENAKGRQLKEEKDKLVEDIKLEIEDSSLNLKNACEKVTVAKDAVAQAEENVRVYRARYAAGSATSTEVLEAITLETKAQTNYFSDDYELKRNYAKLMYSMGINLEMIYERMENKNGS